MKNSAAEKAKKWREEKIYLIYMQVSTNLGNPTAVIVHLDYNVNLLDILVFTRFDPDAKKSTEPTFLRTYLING